MNDERRPRIIKGTERRHTIDLALSGEEMRALLDLSEETGMRPAEVLRQALREYQARRHPVDPGEPTGCMGDEPGPAAAAAKEHES